MATSRRRERELARRRYERRRQAEIERRAKAKRRNTIAGAITGTAIVVAVLLILTFTVFTGGKSNKSSVSDAATIKTCASINPNPPIKGAPTVPPVGIKPTTLTTHDIKVGHGPAAKAGDSVEVFYTGVACSTGKLFDSSYKYSPVTPFKVSPLGSAQVIPGWNQGLIGVKAGGERELIIPPSLAYGTAGSGSAVKPNETLIFDVQVQSVTPPAKTTTTKHKHGKGKK